MFDVFGYYIKNEFGIGIIYWQKEIYRDSL